MFEGDVVYLWACHNNRVCMMVVYICMAHENLSLCHNNNTGILK
jgi:hypothetical protein